MLSWIDSAKGISLLYINFHVLMEFHFVYISAMLSGIVAFVCVVISLSKFWTGRKYKIIIFLLLFFCWFVCFKAISYYYSVICKKIYCFLYHENYMHNNAEFCAISSQRFFHSLKTGLVIWPASLLMLGCFFKSCVRIKRWSF